MKKTANKCNMELQMQRHLNVSKHSVAERLGSCQALSLRSWSRLRVVAKAWHLAAFNISYKNLFLS